MDKRKKRTLVVLGLASLVLVWRLYAITTKYLPAPAQAEPAIPAAVVMPAASSSTTQFDAMLEAKLALQQKTLGEDWGRNPFEADMPVTIVKADTPPPVREKAPDAPEIKIVGVSASDGQWIAAINGNILRVGDAINEDFKVRRITKHAVTLESRGWSFSYSLGSMEPAITRIDGSHDD